MQGQMKEFKWCSSASAEICKFVTLICNASQFRRWDAATLLQCQSKGLDFVLVAIHFLRIQLHSLPSFVTLFACHWCHRWWMRCEMQSNATASTNAGLTVWLPDWQWKRWMTEWIDRHRYLSNFILQLFCIFNLLAGVLGYMMFFFCYAFSSCLPWQICCFWSWLQFILDQL